MGWCGHLSTLDDSLLCIATGVGAVWHLYYHYFGRLYACDAFDETNAERFNDYLYDYRLFATSGGQQGDEACVWMGRGCMCR